MTGKKLTKESGMGASLLRIIIDKWELVRKTYSIKNSRKLMMYGFQWSCPPVSYEGQVLFKEMIDIMEKLGYKLYGIEPGFTAEKTGRMLQMDGIFFKPD